MISIMSEICEMNHINLKLGAIYSDVNKDIILKKFQAGQVEPCGKGPPPLEKEDIEGSANIVAQIGSEPFLKLLSESKVLYLASCPIREC